MRLVKVIFVATLTVLFVQPLVAQPKPKPRAGQAVRQNFNDLQLKMIIHELNIEEGDIESFTKLYHEYLSVMAKNRTKELNPNLGTMASPMTIEEQSDSEVEKELLQSFDRSIKGTEIKRDYYHKFREILTPKQIALMYDIERRTRERFIKEIRNREGEPHPMERNRPAPID